MDIEKMELQKREIDQNVIKRPKLLKAAVIGLAVFVIVAATTLVAVYIGGKMTKDTYQEAWETVQDLEGRYMEERMNKSKDMTEIDVPNTVQIIYDYKNNLAVFRYTYSESKIRDRCYARAIDSEFDPKQLGYDTESEGKNPEFISTTRKWKFTEREVPSYMTSSSRVQDMCSGTQIYWMEVMADTQIEKRQASGNTREIILILPVNLFGIPCNIFVYLERNSFGIPVGITFSTPDCTPLTTSTSATTTVTSTTTASTPTTPTSSATTTVTSTTTASTTSMTTTTPTSSMSTTTTTIPTTTPC